MVREGIQKNVFFSSLLLQRGGVSGNMRKLLGFFMNHVFVGVFQYDFNDIYYFNGIHRNIKIWT